MASSHFRIAIFTCKQAKGWRHTASVPIDWQPGTPIAASERWPMGDGIETELFAVLDLAHF